MPGPQGLSPWGVQRQQAGELRWPSWPKNPDAGAWTPRRACARLGGAGLSPAGVCSSPWIGLGASLPGHCCVMGDAFLAFCSGANAGRGEMPHAQPPGRPQQQSGPSQGWPLTAASTPLCVCDAAACSALWMHHYRNKHLSRAGHRVCKIDLVSAPGARLFHAVAVITP